MNKGAIDRLLRSTPWKVVATLLLLVLTYAVVQLVVTAYHALKFYEHFGVIHGAPLVAPSDVLLWGAVSGSLLFVILLAGLMDLLSFFFIASQFRALTEVINRFAQGELSQRAAVEKYHGHRDIERLGRAFNQMADTIVGSLDELKRNDDARRELVANVAHDLGTPLTSLQGYVETILLKDDSLSSEDRRSYLQIILGNTKALSHLVAELTALSRLDALDTAPSCEAFSIVTLARGVASRFTPAAEKAQVSIEVNAPPHAALAEADVGMIERVLSNILENAVRYSRPRGRIEIDFVEGPDKLTVSIRDNGIGIPEQDLPYVTNRFFRVDKDRARSSGGSGLGLAIAKKVLDLHQCSLEIQSQAGVGTRVSFELPRAVGAVEPQAT